MKAQISTQILDGNLGDGWIDICEAAHALAEFTEQAWANDLSDMDVDVDIDIDVQCNTIGSSRDMNVDVDSDDYEDEERVRAALTDEQQIWVAFLDSDDARALAE